MSNSGAQIEFQIDGKPYSTKDDDQQAASLLRLVGREPADYDLAIIEEHGVEHLLKDKDIVNLKSGMKFRTRAKVHYTVDGESFTTHDDDQEAAAIMRRAGVDPARFDLTRDKGNGNFDTFKDGDVVRIENGDKFVTAKQDGGVA